MSPIEADRYREEVAILESDDIVIGMAKDLRGAPRDQIRHLWIDDDLTEPTMEGMRIFTHIYDLRRHEQNPPSTNTSRSLGGVAKAVGSLLKAERNDD